MKTVKMKCWTTIYPPMINVELIKHVGQFPNIAYFSGNYRSVIVCYNNGTYSLLKKAPGITIDFIKNTGNETKDVIIYILKHAKQIDVLHMFHIKTKTLLPIFIYKILNPRGKVWLDTDINISWLDQYEKKKRGELSERIEHLFEKAVLKLCSLVSAPSSICADGVRRVWNLKPGRVQYVPLGFLNEDIQYNSFNKQKSFICVGRLGEKQKNVELLVNAFCQTMNQHDWDLILIGTATEAFKKYLQDKQEKYNAYNRIIYKGEIYDRNSLYEEYSRASVFVLPSRFESFGIVLCEAMAQGCYILESDSNPAHNDIIRNEIIGTSFKNNRLSDLKNKLIEVTKTEYLEDEYIEYRKRFSEAFTYPNIYGVIRKYL